MFKITKSKRVRAFRKKPEPTFGASVTVVTFPPRSKDDLGGVILVEMAKRLTPESIGSERVITTRVQTRRKGRSIVTAISLRLPVAVMLRDALSRILDDPDIVKEVSDEPV